MKKPVRYGLSLGCSENPSSINSVTPVWLRLNIIMVYGVHCCVCQVQRKYRSLPVQHLNSNCLQSEREEMTVFPSWKSLVFLVCTAVLENHIYFISSYFSHSNFHLRVLNQGEHLLSPHLAQVKRVKYPLLSTCVGFPSPSPLSPKF